MWYRVFATFPAVIEPAALLEALHQAGFQVAGQFRGDEQGWFAAQLEHSSAKLALERFLVQEEGLRAEINTWLAWVELHGGENAAELTRRLLATQEVFTLVAPAGQEFLAEWLCRYLAERGNGIYQMDNRGFFEATGELLARE